MTIKPEALRLAEAMGQRVIPRWVHATGETPRQYGFAADAECQAAAAELRRLHAECEALWAAFNAACAFIDCHVGDWDLTKEMVSKHAAFVKARAELAARAAKEQSK